MNKKFSKRISAAAGSLAAVSMVSQDAQAVIVHTVNPLSLSMVSPGDTDTGITVDWDVDGAFGVDFRLARASYYVFLQDGPGLNGQGFVNSTDSNSNSIRNLNAGDVVGPTLAAGYYFGVQTNMRTVLENQSTVSNPASVFGGAAVGFTDDVAGFAGFQFDANGTTLYGWASLTFDVTAPSSITINEWAFEDTGAAITVGDTGAAAVPEPSSVALLAMGAVGLATWRRRRKSGSAEA